MTGVDWYGAMRRVIEKELGIAADLPHAEAVRRMEAYQRREADRRWRAGECECCIGCPEAYLCRHCRGDFPEMRPLRMRGR